MKRRGRVVSQGRYSLRETSICVECGCLVADDLFVKHYRVVHDLDVEIR